MDFGIDYRQHSPANLSVGPVLSIDDAVGNKVAALFSRGEVRDYLDVDSMRQSGRFTDQQLIELGRFSDPGFDTNMFVQRLQWAARIEPDRVERYDITSQRLAQIKARCLHWADELSAE